MSIQIERSQIVEALIVALEEFRTIDPKISANSILTLLAVAKEPGLQQMDMGQKLGGLPYEKAQELVRNLADNRTLAAEGLIRQEVKQTYRKRKLLFPTVTGLSVLDRITERINASLLQENRGDENS